MVWRIDGPQGAESKKIVWEVAPFLRGRGLDLGCGPFKVLPHVISVDNNDHGNMFGHYITPDINSDALDLGMFASKSMDFVFSSHLLEHINDYKAARPERTALVCRFGAFGDLMQASSVFAGLKKQGYHVTLMTSLPGADVISQDPNIDSIMLLDKDQVPNPDLAAFWKYQSTKYTKFVNLSESVEGTLLAMPGRTAHGWTPLIRHEMMNRNYVEFQHKLAGVPHAPNIKFFPTREEREWAKATRSKMGKFAVLWSLAGSSVHKTWAGLDHILASIMLGYPDAHVVLCGGPECVILEAGWEKEPRVHLTSGKWSIRQSLAFASTQADLVIGPETGVLNAVANEKVPKIVFLSHSTVENLTRDWTNTVSMWGRDTSCVGRGDNEAPACHQMHYGFTHCTKHEESGTAQCQVDISVEEVWLNINEIMAGKFK